MEKYKHIKSGKIYVILHQARNCTNAQDGQMMYIYQELNEATIIYTRSIVEFHEKFVLVNPDVID